MMRASILTVREMEYVEAARSINSSTWHILSKYIIPNSISPLIVTITMNVGNAILIGAMLSFVGLGVQPPTPEWGTVSFRRPQLYAAVSHAGRVPGCEHNDNGAGV